MRAEQDRKYLLNVKAALCRFYLFPFLFFSFSDLPNLIAVVKRPFFSEIIVLL